MKKLLFALALVAVAASAQAQNEQEYPVLKNTVNTNSFWSNWFVGAGFDLEASYSDEERHLGISKNPFQSKRLGYGGEIYVGKWFVPSVGVRLRGHVGTGKRVDLIHKGFSSFNIQAQVLFNLNNIFCGYNPKRVWTISPYLGVGFAHHMWHSVANSSDASTANGHWNGGGDWCLAYSVGLFNQFNITKRWFVSFDVYAQAMSANFDGFAIETPEANLSNTRDCQFGASVGVGVNLGKTGWEKTPDVNAIMEAHNSAVAALSSNLAAQEQENTNLKNMITNRKPQTNERVVKEVVAGAPASVFFNLNSAKVASKKDLVNVQGIADFAKQNGKKIVVTGYADSKTGSAAYNQKLSEKRANTVADALVNMGVARENIIVEGKGGVNDLAPFSYNRRVVVKVQ